MILARHSMTDAALAARVLAGDGQAFAELAHRYREMIGFTIRNPAEGLTATTSGKRRCSLCWRRAGAMTRRAGRSARSPRSACARESGTRGAELARSDATLADTIADLEGTDPARVIELREELREWVIGRREDRKARRRARDRRRRPPHPRERRGRDDPQIDAALALLAEGKTTRHVGAVVGVSSVTVSRWSRRFREG